MKNPGLDIEKIGGLTPLKKSEEKLISDYLKKHLKSKQRVKNKNKAHDINQEVD